MNDEDPEQNDTNYITDDGSINNDEQEINNDNEFDDTHVMDEISEETVILNDNDNFYSRPNHTIMMLLPPLKICLYMSNIFRLHLLSYTQ